MSVERKCLYCQCHTRAANIELLEKKIRFYESIIIGMPPHHRTADKPCKIAAKHEVACCNPKCNGNWGTGCWCCHYLEFAAEADQEAIDAHLALLVKPPGIDEMHGRVTTAILEAKAAARRAWSAHMDVSRIEEEIANALPASDDMGALGGLGVVTAAMAAGDSEITTHTRASRPTGALSRRRSCISPMRVRCSAQRSRS